MPGWLNFTAVGGALLYFGARRSWREMLAPLAVLMATDYFLTVFTYHYAFRWEAYLPTWAWYVAAMALGQILLSARTTFMRVAAGDSARTDLVLRDFELRRLGRWRNVSAHTGRARGAAMPRPFPSTAMIWLRPRLFSALLSAFPRCCGACMQSLRRRSWPESSVFPTLAAETETRRGWGTKSPHHS